MDHARTKHVDMMLLKIRELLSSRQLLLKNAHISNDVAYMLNKLVINEKAMFLNVKH